MLPKTGTFCPRLWEEIFIDAKGDVYSCCHFKPRAMGNIYKEDVMSICNNGTIRSLREKALNGRLECFDTCTLLQKETIVRTKDRTTIDYSELVRIKVEFSQACNIRCVMCWQDHESKEELDCGQLIRNVDITPFRRVEVQGGEPFFIDSAKKYFDYAVSLGKKVDLITNGLLIDKEWAEKIAGHSSFVSVSLNAATKKTHESINKGSRWETVLDNIREIRDARDRLSTDVRIVGHMTIIDRNLKEIPLFIADFQKLGFDGIQFGYDKKAPLFLNMHFIKKNMLRKQIQIALMSLDQDARGRVNSHRLKLLRLV